jgi:hypothetical protein
MLTFPTADCNEDLEVVGRERFSGGGGSYRRGSGTHSKKVESGRWGWLR